MLEFEWDPEKAQENLRKHGVRFSYVGAIFTEPNVVTIYDDEHSDSEDRFISIGRDLKGTVVVVSHTYRVRDGKEWIRIISARKADKDEELKYYGKGYS